MRDFSQPPKQPKRSISCVVVGNEPLLIRCTKPPPGGSLFNGPVDHRAMVLEPNVRLASLRTGRMHNTQRPGASA